MSGGPFIAIDAMLEVAGVGATRRAARADAGDRGGRPVPFVHGATRPCTVRLAERLARVPGTTRLRDLGELPCGRVCLPGEDVGSAALRATASRGGTVTGTVDVGPRMARAPAR